LKPALLAVCKTAKILPFYWPVAVAQLVDQLMILCLRVPNQPLLALDKNGKNSSHLLVSGSGTIGKTID
jgi:hypothetical protein